MSGHRRGPATDAAPAWSTVSDSVPPANGTTRRVRGSRPGSPSSGFEVDRRGVPDEGWQIEEALVAGAAGHGSS